MLNRLFLELLKIFETFIPWFRKYITIEVKLGGSIVKKLFPFMMFVLLLSACSQEIDFQNEIDTMEKHVESFATGNRNLNEIKEFTTDFNKKLEQVKPTDNKAKKYIELQLKANRLRLEGFENMDFDKITESASLQAQALEIYDEIKD